MTTPIGYATLQIIPSLQGIEGAVDKQLSGKMRVIGTAQGKSLAKGVGVGLKDLEREVESAGRAYQKLKDRAADSLGKVSTEEAKLAQLKSSGRANDAQLVAATERLSKARRDSARASRDASDGHAVLTAAQTRAGAGAATSAAQVGLLAGAAAKVGPALASAGAIAGGAALAGITALGAGVAVAANRLYELGSSFDDLSDNLQIKTGLSGDALEGLKGRIEALGTTKVPSTFGEIGDVAAEVTRSLHLTGPAFDEVTSRLANLQRMGVDVDVRTLGKAFRGFGVDAAAQAAALNSLYEVSTRSGLSIDDLTAAVAKGGPALRQLGLDFGASAALIANFEAAGLDGEKGMTALTKATTYFAKENIPAKQGLQDTIAEIQRLGDTPAAADLSNKVFGAKGGAAFYEAIRNGTLDLQSLQDSLSTTGLDINQVSEDTADWSEKWQILKNNVSLALEPLASGLFDAVNAQLGTAADTVIANKDKIVDAIVGIGDVALTMAENFAHGVGGMLQAVGDLVGGIGNVKGVLDDAMANVKENIGDDAGAAKFRASAQEAYGWGESIRAAGDKLANVSVEGLREGMHSAADNAQAASTRVNELAGIIGRLPGAKDININAIVVYKDTAGIVIPPDQLRSQGIQRAIPGETIRPGQHATGGPIRGPGGPKSDKIPAWLSNGEHVFTAADVQAMGGQAAVYAFRNMLHRSGGGGIFPMAVPWGVDPNGGRDPSGNPGPSAGPFGPWWDMDWMPPEHPEKVGPSIPGVNGKWWHRGPAPGKTTFAFPPIGKYRPPLPGERWPEEWNPGPQTKGLGVWLGFAGGGAVAPDVKAAGALVGTAYSQANRTDCSGMVARVIDRTLGMPETGLMSTKNAKEWLAARGFKSGIGGPGQISVGWYDHGPNPNEGHMAMTLSDGSNAEAGGGVGDIFQIGGGAAGASNPEFDQHMYLPTVWGEGPAGSAASPASSSPFAGGSAVDAMIGSPPSSDGASSSSSGSSSGGGGSSFNFPSSFSELAGLALAGMGITTSAGAGSPDRTFAFGDAAASALGGQAESFLDVFGVGESPGWLKGLSTLISGISIGGGSANPLSAAPGAIAAAVPGDDSGNMHGNRAGQAPGPTYNITARDTEDAFVKAQRVEREKAAAKLSRF